MNKLNWVDVISIALAIIGLGSSYYFYELSVQKREPILIEEPYRALVVEAAAINKSSISIVKTNGNVLMKDISSLKFYLFNRGGESIKKQHILKPLQIELANPDIEILDIKILSVSRPDVVLPTVSIVKGAKNLAHIDFNILEGNDGFSAQVLFAGTHATPLQIHGVIEGVNKVLTNEDIKSTLFFKYSFFFPAIIVCTGLLYAALRIFSSSRLIRWRSARTVNSNSSFPKSARLLIAALLAALLLMALLFVVYLSYKITWGIAETSSSMNVVSSVPSSIRSQY